MGVTNNRVDGRQREDGIARLAFVQDTFVRERTAQFDTAVLLHSKGGIEVGRL